MNLKEIKDFLSKKDLDARVIPLVELFVLGKSKVDNLDDEETKRLIDKLCVNIHNTEFIDDDKVIAAYTEGANILSINKRFLTEERIKEAIVPIFMKMEQSLHTETENEYARHSLDFNEAFQIARKLKIPMTQRLQNIGFYVEMLINNAEQYLNNEHIKEVNYIDSLASKFEETLNEMIITGIDNRDSFLEAYRILNVIRYQEKDEGKRDKLYSREESIKFIRILDKIERKKPIIEIATYYQDRSYEDYIRPDLMRQYDITQEEIDSFEFPRIDGDYDISNHLGRIGAIKPEDITVEFIEKRINEIMGRKKDAWNPGMGKLLVPFFIRSSIIFDWNRDELVQRINELDANIKTIDYTEEGLREDVMGAAGIEDIRIRKNAYGQTFDNYRIPLSTFFHEVGHTIDTNEREGIVNKANEGYSFDKFYEWRNTIFEYLVSRSSGKFYKDAFAYIVNPVSGYVETLNVGSMLSAALGISELELAKLKDKGNDSIGKLLIEITGMPEDEVIPHPFQVNRNEPALMQRLVADFDLIYPMPFDLKTRSRNQAKVNDMYEICIEIMRRRMEKDLIQGDGDADDYLVRQAYFLRKINENYVGATKEVGLRSKRKSLTHKVDFASDKISQIALFDIGEEFIRMVDFGFDNARDISPYRLQGLVEKKLSIFDKLRLSFVPTVENGRGQSKESTSKEREDKE